MKLEISNKIFFAEVERLISEGENVTITIKGCSMRPLLRDGRHKVVLTPCHSEMIREGEIALFRHKGNHVLHRIIDIENDSITFAGDGNINRKEIVSRKDIIAITKSIITPSGRIVDCSSREWRIKSKMWLTLPQTARRVILGIARRL